MKNTKILILCWVAFALVVGAAVLPSQSPDPKGSAPRYQIIVAPTTAIDKATMTQSAPSSRVFRLDTFTGRTWEYQALRWAPVLERGETLAAE